VALLVITIADDNYALAAYKAANTYTGEEGGLCVSPGGPGEYRVREGPCEAAAFYEGDVVKPSSSDNAGGD